MSDDTEARARGRRKEARAVVVSDKMDKTVVVAVSRFVRHGKYHKYLSRRARYKAHDEKNQCRVGDRVGSSRRGRCHATSAGPCS